MVHTYLGIVRVVTIYWVSVVGQSQAFTEDPSDVPPTVYLPLPPTGGLETRMDVAGCSTTFLSSLGFYFEILSAFVFKWEDFKLPIYFIWATVFEYICHIWKMQNKTEGFGFLLCVCVAFHTIRHMAPYCPGSLFILTTDILQMKKLYQRGYETCPSLHSWDVLDLRF